MALVLDRALTNLDQFDRSIGSLIHLNRVPVKQKGSNMNFNGPKLGSKISNFNVGPKQSPLSPDHEGLTHGCTNHITLHVLQVGPMVNMLNKVGPNPLMSGMSNDF